MARGRVSGMLATAAASPALGLYAGYLPVVFAWALVAVLALAASAVRALLGFAASVVDVLSTGFGVAVGAAA